MSHAGRAHARFSASAAHRWLICHGYTRLVAQVPEAPAGAAAQRGTEAHEVLERMLRAGHVNAYAYPELALDYQECVQEVVDYVAELRRLDPAWQLLVETEFDLSSYVNADCGGTADIALWHPAKRELRIVDMKTGTQPVRAEENVQELTYGAGVCFELKLRPARVVLVVIGTRFLGGTPAVQEWETDAARLAEFVGEIEEAVRAAEAPDAPLVAGDHCEYCPAAGHLCPAREAHALTVLGEQFRDVRQVEDTPLPEPSALNPARVSFILHHAERLRGWLDAVEGYAEAELRAGRQASAPGFKLVETKARGKWAGDADEIGAALARISGAPYDTFVVPKLLGLTEAQQQVRKAVREACESAGLGKKETTAWLKDANEKVAFLIDRQSSGNLTLVPDSDPRPAYRLTQDAFVGVAVEAEDAQDAEAA